jgi:hypothetical protein
MQPSRPRHFPEHAEPCLEALTANELGHKISLGGAFGLLHYLDYRATHDVDAWWHSSASQADQARVVEIVQGALRPAGDVRMRTWGQGVSIELRHGAKKVFSFQIAKRSAQLRTPTPAPWGDVLLDSFVDLVASKMVALVERGAPRDFRDVHAVCQSGLATPTECWRLWRQHQELSGSPTDPHRARLAVEMHLARIVQHRPLAKITDPAQRAEAERARQWYKTELLDALMD